MSAATRATTAKQRAEIALRMMKNNKSGCFSRAFDDCFEMGDGDQVVEEIARRAMCNPELLEIVMRNRGVSWCSVKSVITRPEVKHTPPVSREMMLIGAIRAIRVAAVLNRPSEVLAFCNRAISLYEEKVQS